MAISSLYEGLKSPMPLTEYTLMRGVTDFGNLKQYDLYESGYPFLVVVDYPNFLKELAKQNTDYATLINNYIHILEYEFRGIDGIDNITTDSQELTNGINNLNIITKVNEQSSGSFTMRFFEKSGSVITRTHELFLRSIKDPRTQVKTYSGLIDDGVITTPGFHHEVFTFLYFVTDNTMTQIEKAYLIIAAQPQSAETNIYNSEKGTIEFKELSCEFSGFPYTSKKVNQAAKDILEWLNGFSINNGVYSKTGNRRIRTSSNNVDYTAKPMTKDTSSSIASDYKTAHANKDVEITNF
jgi:hypothetical protein